MHITWIGMFWLLITPGFANVKPTWATSQGRRVRILETVIMVAAGRGEARAGRLPSGGRSPITQELHNIIREIFRIAPEIKDKDTTGRFVIIMILIMLNFLSSRWPDDHTKKPNGNTTSVDSPLDSQLKTKTTRRSRWRRWQKRYLLWYQAGDDWKEHNDKWHG